MFHSAHIHVPRNRRPSALRTFITSSSFGPPDTKEPLRRGILLTAVAFVLLLIGSILTWLGFNDVFGGQMSMTGPLLIALSLLLLLLSFRQFLLARKRNNNSRSSMQLDSVNGERMTAVVVNRDDGLRPATVIVDRYHGRYGHDGAITVHRHIDEDYAPPSYHEVTQLSSSSNTPSCATHDGQDELPPTYEETMGSTIYPLAQLLRTSSPFSLPSQQERSAGLPFPTPTVAVTQVEVSRGGGAISSELGAHYSMVSPSAGCVLPRPMHKHSPPKPSVPYLQLETRSGGGMEGGVAVVNATMSGPHVMQPTQHCLTLPTLHMSAPTSPRQLSAPPSPHPFSAPPSPRHLNFQRNLTPPPQYLLPNSSSLQLSAPPSLHVLSASPSHPTFSTQSSPRPLSGQHSLTPPPQYTSTPPSPHQLSAPSSPHIFSPPRSPCFVSSSLAMQPLSPQPPAHYMQASSLSSQLPGPADPFSSSAPTPVPHGARPWSVSSLHTGSNNGEGNSCFTYSFVTVLPAETSPVLPSLHTHSSAVRYPVRDYSSMQPGFPTDGIRPGALNVHPPTAQAAMYTGARAFVRASPNPQRGVQEGDVICNTFTSRTDIQANI